jgi:GNAT superfamily N-acetyltransferase
MISILDTPRGPITIRPTRQDDAHAYRELRLEALRAHPEAFGADYDEDLARPLDFWAERVRNGAGTEQNILYIAEAGGALVGMTGIFRHNGAKMRHTTHIWGVYVRPEWRGLGIIDALITACVGWARAQGARQVKLSVVTTNAAAIRSYVRCGFSVYAMEPEVIFYNGVYYDELLMIQRLVDDKVAG